ncbi:MAG: hypothetical protein IJ007_00855, partial [Oscillospiraceae bacterium]|nr:hypothetical protein [Oscillospiraceae bacterium]
MGNDGELKFGTKLDSSGLIKELNGLGSKAKRALGSITKGVFAIGGALTAVTGIALNFKGELEQNLGGSEAVFGKYAKGLQEKAETAFKNMGLSASDYLATANKMGALFKGAGFEQEEAANKASEAMQRAADIASIMGIDVSVAMESIAGAAKGNFTMMDNLGVAMNDTTLNAYALEKGIGKTTKQMTNQEKVALAMEMFLDRTSYAAGNYAKENETLAGSLTTAKAALKNYLAGTGDVDDVVDSLTNAAKVIMKNVKELLPKLVKGLGKGIRQILPLVPDMLRELIPAVASVIGDLIATVAEMAPDIIIALAEGIGDSVPVLKPFTDILKVLAENLDVIAPAIIPVVAAIAAYEAATSLAAAAQTALNLAMSLSPLGLAAAAVAVVAGGVTALALAAQNSQNSYESMGKEIEATTDKVASSMQKVNETDVKIEQWNELKDSLNDTSLSSEELEDRQAKLKDVEQWFIDNYGEYISAEEQKNGIRDDTIKKISNQADLLERANKLELANTILKNKDNIPELEKETEALKQQNKELDELRTGIAYERDEVKLLAAEWENQILQLENGNITQDEFDENIRKIKNSLAEMGRESNSFDAVS